MAPAATIADVLAFAAWAVGTNLLFAGPFLALLVALAAFALGGTFLGSAIDTPRVGAFTTVFIAIVMQAIPFLVLGVLISSAIVAFVPRDLAARAPTNASEAERDTARQAFEAARDQFRDRVDAILTAEQRKLVSTLNGVFEEVTEATHEAYRERAAQLKADGLKLRAGGF